MEKIILPLDGFTELATILHVIRKVQEAEMHEGAKVIWGFKVNDALIQHGLDIVKRIKEEGFRVFADPKLKDIPNTINNSVTRLIDAGADIISVHCSGQYIPTNEIRKHIAGITVLTSMSEKQCRWAYGSSIRETVVRFYAEAKICGYGYLVCSPKELNYFDFDDSMVKITPGIRPEWYQKEDDQKRVATPADAIKAGTDLLVIGRPILKAVDMLDAIKQTNKEIALAQEELINNNNNIAEDKELPLDLVEHLESEEL